MILQFLQISVLRQEFREILFPGERIQVSENSVSFHLPRIGNLQVIRIGVHAHDFLVNCLRRVGQVDAVADGLGHLRLAVCARKTQAGLVLRQVDLRLHQHVGVIDPIKTPYNLSGLLQHRLLVFSHRHCRRLECRDVRRLAHRISEETRRNAGTETLLLNFRLHGRIPLQSGHRDQVHEVECHLGQFRDF